MLTLIIALALMIYYFTGAMDHPEIIIAAAIIYHSGFGRNVNIKNYIPEVKKKEEKDDEQ